MSPELRPRGDSLPAAQDQEAPSALKEGARRQRLEERPAGDVNERLSSTRPRHVRPTSLEPDIIGVTPARGEPGTRVRIRGRHLEPGGDRREHKLLLRRVGSGYDDSGKRMDVRTWTDERIVAIVPPGAEAGPSEILLSYPLAGGRREAESVDFEVLEAPSVPGGGELPGDAGKPAVEPRGGGGGGFASVPEPADRPVVRVGGIVSGQLEYGRSVEVEFYNSGDRAAYIMPAYQFGGGTARAARAGPVNIPAKLTKSLRMRIDLRPAELPLVVKQQIAAKGEVLMTLFPADPDGRSGSSAEEWRYGDSPAHFRPTGVKRSVDLEIELVSLTRYARCRDWAERRDWQFFVFLIGTELWTTERRLDHKPADVVSEDSPSISARTRLGPMRWQLPIELGAEKVGFRAQLRALKGGGGYKNEGHYAQFDWNEWFDPYHPRGSAHPSGWKPGARSVVRVLGERDIRSTEPRKPFCDPGNLEFGARMTARMVPYRR
ncbi:MAG: hypothetical protein GWO02_20405 [Gammaproteobacteria bacterium]|nr:hypothetical protein [Gammaproteobacteria bacterium]